MQIGEILKDAREEKNISLDDIQAETKIQKRYLVAIEQDDFNALPGKFYARAFIKEYAQAVGLDPDEVLQGFDESEIASEEPATQYTRMNRTNQAKDSKGSSFLSFLPTVIVIILIIAILFTAWSLYQKKTGTSDNENNEQIENNEIYRDKEGGEQNPGANNENEDASNNNEVNDENASEDEQTDEEDEFSVEEEGTGDFPESTLNFTHGGDKVEVKFEVSGSSYAEFKGGDDKDYFVGTLEPADESETYDVSDEEELFFKVGNAQGVKIFINDVELKYPIDTSTVTQKLRVNLKKAE